MPEQALSVLSLTKPAVDRSTDTERVVLSAPALPSR